jgi:hypothetical protein
MMTECNARNVDINAASHTMTVEEVVLTRGMRPAHTIINTVYVCPDCGIRVSTSVSAHVQRSK